MSGLEATIMGTALTVVFIAISLYWYADLKKIHRLEQELMATKLGMGKFRK